jgi:hypothetical protein
MVFAADTPGVQILLADPGGCTWVETKSSVAFGQHETKHQAKAQAISEARGKAIEGFLGVKVQDRFMNFMQESSLKGQVRLTESLIRVTQHGRILKEVVLDVGPEDSGDRYFAHIRACIVPLKDQSDKGFKVDVSLNRTRFVEGDEGLITVTATRDAYFYIYSVDVDSNAVMLFPNDFAPDSHVKIGQAFVFPTDELKNRGMKVKARLPAGVSVSAEMIRVIASKEPLPFSLSDSTNKNETQEDVRSTSESFGTGTWLNLMQKLNATQTEWVEDAQAFTIYKK